MNWRKWLDEFILAGEGILLATKEKRFWYGFIPSFLFFGLLMNLLSSGTAKFELMPKIGFFNSLQIIWDNLLALFGFQQTFSDWLPIFLIALLQGILIGLVVLFWAKKINNSAKLEKAGIITGLITLGAGCPTCGTTLLTPLITTLFSSGGLTIAGAISTFATWLAIVIAIFVLKSLGKETYVIIINEKYLAKKGKKEQNEKNTQNR